MRPIPGNVIGIGISDIVRCRWCRVEHGLAIRLIVVEAAFRWPERRTTDSSVMPDKWSGYRTGGRRSNPRTRPGSWPRKRFVRGKHDHCDTERGEKRQIHSIRHGTHHIVGCRKPAPQRRLGRAYRARKHIINNWLKRQMGGPYSVPPKAALTRCERSFLPQNHLGADAAGLHDASVAAETGIGRGQIE